MRHQEGFFTSARSTRIYHQCWLPDKELKGVLMIVHGLGEHSGRYLNLVNYFVPAGFAVYGMDHAGHGKSEGPRKHIDRFEDFIDDITIFYYMVRACHADKPVFLVGHSMGGLISAIFLLDDRPGLHGAIFSGPSVQIPGDISPITVVIGKMLAVLMPKIRLIHTDPEGLSRDPAVIQAYIDDPLVYKGKTTARLAAELLKTMQRVPREAAKITLPILILQGGADRIVDPTGARMLHDAVGSADKHIIIYENLFHEIYNEPEHPQVLQDMAFWISSRMPADTDSSSMNIHQVHNMPFLHNTSDIKRSHAMKCPLCNSRKGKRKCLITEGSICSLCCGQTRNEAACQGCVFYQADQTIRKYSDVPSYSTKQMGASDELQGYSDIIETALCECDHATKGEMKDPDAVRIYELLIDKYYFKDETFQFENDLIEKGFNHILKAMKMDMPDIPEDKRIKVLGVLRFVAKRWNRGRRDYFGIINGFFGNSQKIRIIRP